MKNNYKNIFWEQVKNLKGKNLYTKKGIKFLVSNRPDEISDDYIVIYRNTQNGDLKRVKLFRMKLEEIFERTVKEGKFKMSMVSMQIEFGIKEVVYAYSVIASVPLINCIDKNGIPSKILKLNK